MMTVPHGVSPLTVKVIKELSKTKIRKKIT
jgi:hypothetical protein